MGGQCDEVAWGGQHAVPCERMLHHDRNYPSYPCHLMPCQGGPNPQTLDRIQAPMACFHLLLTCASHPFTYSPVQADLFVAPTVLDFGLDVEAFEATPLLPPILRSPSSACPTILSPPEYTLSPSFSYHLPAHSYSAPKPCKMRSSVLCCLCCGIPPSTRSDLVAFFALLCCGLLRPPMPPCTLFASA